MSVYIKGLEMPTNCSRQGCPLFACIAAYKTGMICTVLNEYVEKGKKNPRCPLVHVPPHGRSIDAEYAKEHIRACMGNGRPMYSHDSNEICKMLNDCPTIIPAELSVHHGTFAATSEQEALKRIILPEGEE